MTQTAEQIEKPWAIYGAGLRREIGEVVWEGSDGKFVSIWHTEEQQSTPACRNTLYVERFSSPIRAIDTFFEKNYCSPSLMDQDRAPTREEIAGYFLKNFPSQRENLTLAVNI